MHCTSFLVLYFTGFFTTLLQTRLHVNSHRTAHKKRLRVCHCKKNNWLC